MSFLDLARSLGQVAQPEAPALAGVPAAHGTGDPREVAYAARALEAEAETVRTATRGTRNSTLNLAAYKIGGLIGPALDLRTAYDALTAAAAVHATGPEPLPASEAHATVLSGLHAGMAKPRTIPHASTTWAPTLGAHATAELVELAGRGNHPNGAHRAAHGDDSGPGGAISDPAARDRTSWWPLESKVALNADPHDPALAPAYLTRDDGHALLYRGKVNALIGESESGKSWIAQAVTAEAIRAGGRVLYLDFEDTHVGVIGRLRALGLTDEQLEHGLAYAEPSEALHPAALADLTETLRVVRPDVVIIDGVNAAMTLCGYDLDKNKDFTAFAFQLLRPLRAAGAAVVTVDHVTKSREGRGSYAIGAQAKRADVDGVALLIEAEEPFGRGLTGRLTVTVSKDRPGYVRAVCGEAKHAGTVILTSRADGSVAVEVTSPDLTPAAERAPFRPTVLMERVSRHLELLPDGASKAALERDVDGSRDGIRLAIRGLVDDGFATLEAGSRGAVVVKITRPFREADELTSRPRGDLAATSRAARSSTSPNDLATSRPHHPPVGGVAAGREVERAGRPPTATQPLVDLAGRDVGGDEFGPGAMDALIERVRLSREGRPAYTEPEDDDEETP